VDEIRCAIEVRQDDSRASPGRIVGTLMVYETRAQDRPERFLRGPLRWPEGGMILNEQHNRRAPIMRFTPQQAEGRVLIDALLPDTQHGRDAAVLVRDGTFAGLSVEFRAGRERERLWLVPLGERSAVARSTFPMSSGLTSQSMIPRPTARAQPEARWAPTPSCVCGSSRLARRPARRRRCLRAPQAPRSRRRWRR